MLFFLPFYLFYIQRVDVCCRLEWLFPGVRRPVHMTDVTGDPAEVRPVVVYTCQTKTRWQTPSAAWKPDPVVYKDPAGGKTFPEQQHISRLHVSSNTTLSPQRR